VTGDRPESIFIAVAPKRSTHRKENYGYCQESYKEIREEASQEDRRKETRSQEVSKESCAEESGTEKSSEENRRKA
jgi:hypothetical protein